ncbi:ankyrin repeat-containing domain protein [Camillea tinctor]|nr:ankyrin repeat-containing domain protein [Camillea tinctor]
MKRLSRDWTPHRSTIRSLYLYQNKPLKYIIDYMRDNHGFSASKSEYERQLKVWRCRKNGTPEIWEYVARELRARESEGSQSDVYIDGNIIDKAIVKRRTAPSRVFVSSIDSIMPARLPTLDNVAIISPISPMYLDVVKGDGLPWQHLCRQVEQLILNITIRVPSDIRREMVPYLVPYHDPLGSTPSLIKRIVQYLNNILPFDQDDEVYNLLNLVFAGDKEYSTWEFLKLTIYVLSNNLLLYSSYARFRSGGDVISGEILKWFQLGNNRRFVRAMLLMATPSIDSFAKKVFCSAVRQQDLSMIQIFLESGIDPNTPVEWRQRYHLIEMVTPLQFSALVGDFKMTKILLIYKAVTGSGGGLTSVETPLQIAARGGHLDIVKILIAHKAVVNTPRKCGTSALQYAAAGQHYDMVQLLLDEGADINACFGEEHGCALECAIRTKYHGLVELLLESGADINVSGGYHLTPLKAAVMVNDEDMVARLLRNGARVNIRHDYFPYGTNCIEWAATNGNMAILSLLLEHGGDVNSKQGWPRATTLAIAVEKGNYEMVQYLLAAGADVNHFRGKTSALEAAIGNRDSQMISILLEAGADPSQDFSIISAAKSSDYDLIRLLLHRGADINKSSSIDIIRKPTALYHAVGANNQELVQFLLDHGADPNAGTDIFRCPIFRTLARSGNREIMAILIEHGADCNNVYEDSLNPLQTAARNGDQELVQYLIAHNADVNAPAHKKGGRTALQVAVENGHTRLVQFFLEAGADVNAPAASIFGKTALQAAISIIHLELVNLLLNNDAGADDQPAEWGGLSALQCAAKLGSNDLVYRLIQAGADVNGPAGKYASFTALQAAVEGGHIETVRLLLDLGADVNAPAGNYSSTALQIAVSRGRLDIVKILLQNKPDINAPGSMESTNYTALACAASQGYIRIVKLLLERGAELIDQGTMPSLTAAAAGGRIDCTKLLITHALKTCGLNREHLQAAINAANDYRHTAVAKFLESHKVILHRPHNMVI